MLAVDLYLAELGKRDAKAARAEGMMDDRLRAAAKRAREEGYLIGREYDDLRESMGWR